MIDKIKLKIIFEKNNRFWYLPTGESKNIKINIYTIDKYMKKYIRLTRTINTMPLQKNFYKLHNESNLIETQKDIDFIYYDMEAIDGNSTKI